MEKNINKNSTIDFVGFIVPIIFIAAWAILPTLLDTPKYLIPSLSTVAKGFIDFITGSYELSSYSGSFLSNALASTYRVVVGFLIASTLGVGMGILSGYYIYIKRLFDPFIHIIRMIPGIGWFPIAMVWFGVGNKTTIFLVALAAFFPIYVNTLRAVNDVDDTLINVGKLLGASQGNIMRTIILPASLPGIFSGLRLGMGVCWAYLVLGELTGVNEGLGAVMMDSRMLGNVDMIIVCMISIAFLGRIFDLILLAIFKVLRPAELR
ncbi:MAG: ABC transporter permease [Peptostreptococcus sp.]|uniref:ABC transporter permease n=1 Tax=Peptostreptococcus sp. TaxID=1262 RepID=UPI002FC71A7F